MYQQNNNKNNKNNQKENKEKFIRYNWKIKTRQCRIIEEGKQPVIMDTKAAIEYAQRQNLDLVEVGYDPKAGISTAKICEYRKYIYELKRKEKMAKKQARANITEVKSLQIHLTTDTADLERIINQAKTFLAEGNKVKLVLRFRGKRELTNMDYAKEVMKNVLTKFDGLAILDSKPVLNGKELSCIIRKNT